MNSTTSHDDRQAVPSKVRADFSAADERLIVLDEQTVEADQVTAETHRTAMVAFYRRQVAEYGAAAGDARLAMLREPDRRRAAALAATRDLNLGHVGTARRALIGYGVDPDVARDDGLETRDAFAHKQELAGQARDWIRNEIARRGWPALSESGFRKAIEQYATRHGLPLPPPRKRGRK